MKPFHVRILAALPVLVLSVANMPPFIHQWSDTTSDLIAVGTWVALLAGMAVTAPFNRWMLGDQRDYDTRFGRAVAFSLGIVAFIDILLLIGTAMVVKALGLGVIAYIGVSLLMSIVLGVGSVVAVFNLFSWTCDRIGAAYDAADRA
ncbi:hypothetical protein PCE31106_00111 [Pandoraea cepalis]|uniref:Transmembrane protein n=1 Tax=Pandoraea cepalis TaxID=2508294 RepID=A0A5E4RDS3_9BURK|nr:hypothetical protein [Pandoraea cepalis]VVD61327.1 hypothetical protein PCE31106_00111 [Pandoraea cepalis]